MVGATAPANRTGGIPMTVVDATQETVKPPMTARKVARDQTGPIPGPPFDEVIACVDGSPLAPAVVEWAAAIARAFNVPLSAVRVLESAPDDPVPQDPLSWEIRRSEAVGKLNELLQLAESGSGSKAEVMIGPVLDSLAAVLASRPGSLCVVGTTGEGRPSGAALGNNVRRIIEMAPCSVLVVPPDAGAAARGRETEAKSGRGFVRRLMVPLDCSRRAETAIPPAFAIGEAFGSEIVLVHSVPEPVITAVGPLDEADIGLLGAIVERNEKTASRYLSRVRARLVFRGTQLRTLIVKGADARHNLVRAAINEQADLIVLSAKGASGHPDQYLGAVADFLIRHIAGPVLIVKPSRDSGPFGPAETARSTSRGSSGLKPA